jgi:hypothetical protein
MAETLRLSFEETPGAYVLDGDVVHADTVTVVTGPVVSLLGP